MAKKIHVNVVNNGFLRFITLIVLFLNFGVQAQSYTVTQTNWTAGYTTFPLSGRTTLAATGGNVDDVVYPLTIPFSFGFNGGTYTTVNMSTNGFVYFGTATGTPATEYFPISSSATNYTGGGAISVYGRDMDLIGTTATVNMGWVVTGTAPNRIFKMDWVTRRSIGANAVPASEASMVFQLWLYETTNVIEMIYNNATFTNTTAILTGQIGIRGATNTDFINLSYTNSAAQWPGSATTPNQMALGTANTDSVVTKGNTAASATIQATSNRLFRWTPVSCFAPTGLTASNITFNSVDLTWLAASPAPANGYEYYVGTTSPIGASPATGSVGAGVLTASATGLSSGTLYYYAVRSVCSGVDKSAWTTVGTFTTYCAPTNITYYEGFDGPSVVVPATSPNHGNIPSCTYAVNAGTGNPWVTTYEDYYPGLNMFFQGNFLMYNGQSPSNGNTANAWWFTNGLNLTAGTTYRISFFYSGTDTPSTVQNKLKIGLATSPLAAGVTTILDDLPNIKGGPSENVINFTAPSTGVFYIGFNAYSNPNNGQLAVDDVTVAPAICLAASNVTVANITASSALLSWTSPSPAPANGFVYYYNTTGAAPTNATVPSGSVGVGVTSLNLTGLNGSTNYYFWVRTYCGGGDYGEWVALNNSGSGFFTTLYQPPFCVPAVSASPNTSTYITNVTTTGGTANLNNSSGYSTGSYGDYSAQVVAQAPGFSVNMSIGFIATGGVGVAVYVDWNNDGTFAVAERMYNSATYLSTSPVNTVINVPGAQALGDYRMRVVADYWATNPLPCTYGSSPSRWEVEDYTFRVVTPPPPLSINITSDTQCAGNPSALVQLTTPVSNYQSYSWLPNVGVSGSPAAGWTFTNTVTTVYTLTANETIAPFGSRQLTFTYIANQTPTPIVLSPATPTVCGSGPAVQLTSTGGLVSGFPILSENFNTGAPGWTSSSTAAHTGGNTAVSLWQIQNSPYDGIVSPDSSQFMVSDSDGQGSGSTTFVELTSPVFSLVGYTDASLSFYHYYRPWINGTATVYITTNGGTTWTQIRQWTNTANGETTQGTTTNFALVNLPLVAYVGQANVQIKFTYTAQWGWYWAIDNFLVSGTASSAVNWNLATGPVANGVAVPGLYTDAAATTAYIAGTGSASVYALPTATTDYTASASTPAPVCATNSSITVTLSNVGAGTASSDQTICSGMPANLTLTGYTGTITKWQSSTTAAFTTPVDIAASASATLTSVQMGAITATTYYRAVVTNGGCTGYSNVVTITVSTSTWNGSVWSNGVPSLTKSAIFAGNYSSTGDLSACSVTVQSGTVVFNTNHTLTVQNAVTVTGGSLTFENASSLLQVTNAVNSGNITYKRTTTPIRKFDFTYWSSPVAPQTLVALSPLTQFDKYFTFDPVIGNWVTVASSSLMVAGKGYIIRGPNNFDPVVAAPYNASFVGVPNNGTITAPIALGTSDVNLIGNPYPSALNIDLFMDYNGNTGLNLVDKTIYIWTHNTAMTNNNYTNSDYAVYNYMGGVGTAAAPGSNNAVPTGKIASGQSFFIKGLANGNAIFNNTMRVAGNNAQFFRSAADKSRVWLQIYDGAAGYKQTLVGYADGATNGVESGYDGDLFDAGNAVTLYSLVGNSKLTIQGRALPFNVNDVVPLGYKATENGNLTISLHNFDGVFTSQDIYLKDNALNVIHDLKAGDYTFATGAGTFENRFELVYTNNALGIDTPEFSNSVVVYAQNGVIHVQSSSSNLDHIEVYDVRGAKLATMQNVNSNTAQLAHVSNANQLLFVKVTDQNGNTLTRKVQY
ncbi:fibronectin type III domain-containing protein [Flavobacterium stagni]|uniref:T9SS sorting signal type C domain-containing protein n=1 Tax=Flavobacterium stagni TaxID=2506421 RepID=A0A4Q1KBM8_9FLAO|nr:fibronectin type III domain-containing protein [Flavobacterium stagni]RXR22442.1 T9SS sorting signal type C domain-containing protein [Flavobacterium stagni]